MERTFSRPKSADGRRSPTRVSELRPQEFTPFTTVETLPGQTSPTHVRGEYLGREMGPCELIPDTGPSNKECERTTTNLEQGWMGHPSFYQDFGEGSFGRVHLNLLPQSKL